MPQNCGVSKKSKTFELLVIYLLETYGKATLSIDIGSVDPS